MIIVEKNINIFIKILHFFEKKKYSKIRKYLFNIIQ